MHETIHRAIADLSALIEGADSKDAKRIREIIGRLQNFDAHIQCSLEFQCSLECTARLHTKFYRLGKCRE